MSRYSFVFEGTVADIHYNHTISYGFDDLVGFPSGYFYQVESNTDDSSEGLLVDWDTREFAVTSLPPVGKCVTRTEIADSLQMWADMLEDPTGRNSKLVNMLTRHCIQIQMDVPLTTEAF